MVTPNSGKRFILMIIFLFLPLLFYCHSFFNPHAVSLCPPPFFFSTTINSQKGKNFGAPWAFCNRQEYRVKISIFGLYRFFSFHFYTTTPQNKRRKGWCLLLFSCGLRTHNKTPLCFFAFILSLQFAFGIFWNPWFPL